MSFTYAGQYGPTVAENGIGGPLANMPFTVYLAGGLTLATLYTDRTKVAAGPNPSITDPEGNMEFLVDPGRYDVLCNGATLSGIVVYADPSEVASGSVASFAGRSGAVTPRSGDYTAGMVGADASGAAATVQTNLTTEIARAEAEEALLVPLTQKGAASGVAPLDSSARVAATSGVTLNSTASLYSGAGNPNSVSMAVAAVGDIFVDTSGSITSGTAIWQCSVAGTPGTWTQSPVGGGGGGSTPASSVTGPDGFGASPVVGTSALYARQDHDHGLPTAPTGSSPATSVTGPDTFSSGSVVGTSLQFARQDHHHGLPMGVTSFNSRNGVLVPTSGDYTAAMVAAPALSVLTAIGDIYTASGAGAVQRLGTGTSGQVLTANGGGAVPSWKAPSGGGGGGGGILAAVQYAPASLDTLFFNNPGFSAFDLTNLVATFTAPASGRVLVRLSGVASPVASNCNGWFAVGWVDTAHGVVSSVVGPTALVVGVGTIPSGGFSYELVSSDHIIWGLTSGESYTFAFMGASNTTSGVALFIGTGQGNMEGTPAQTAAPTIAVWSA